MPSFDFNLKPNEAINYLKNKGFKLSFDYTDMSREAHHKAFTVAKMTRLDLLTDIHQELIKSLEKGTSFKEFKKNLIPTLQKKGWWGKQEIVNPTTGEVKTVNIGSSRLKTIYETNTRMAYNVAREQQMDELTLYPYRRYVSALLENTRDSHRAMHGIIKHKDDEFWILNSPLNDYNCKCKKQAVSKRDLQRKGWTVNTEKLGDIASDDFAYDIREHKYKLDNLYFQKVQALRCNRSKAFAKSRTVLCPYEEVVKENYKQDIKKSLPTQEEFSKFVDSALDTKIKRYQSLNIGYLSLMPRVLEFLESKNIKPKSDVIVANTKNIRNLKAKEEGSKKGKTLTNDEIKDLINKLQDPDEILWDGDLLFIFNSFIDDRLNKVVIRINYETKKEIFNDLKSAMKINKIDLKAMKYEVVYKK